MIRILLLAGSLAAALFAAAAEPVLHVADNGEIRLDELRLIPAMFDRRWNFHSTNSSVFQKQGFEQALSRGTEAGYFWYIPSDDVPERKWRDGLFCGVSSVEKLRGKRTGIERRATAGELAGRTGDFCRWKKDILSDSSGRNTEAGRLVPRGGAAAGLSVEWKRGYHLG